MKKLLRLAGKIKRRKNAIYFVLAVALIATSVLLLGVNVGFSYFNGQNIPLVKEVILFEGTDCDHCANVDDFITKNNVEQKVVFKRLEVFNSDANANLLDQKARICGLDSSQIGVPFLWDGAHCILGDVDVIAFFKNALAKKPLKT